jgi:recombination protein RecA
MLSSRGISYEGDLLDMAVEDKIVTKSGAWFSYGDTRLGQGRNNAKGFLRENPAIAQELETKIYEAVGVVPNTGGPVAVPDPVNVDEDGVIIEDDEAQAA